jgi:hypothetical protein
MRILPTMLRAVGVMVTGVAVLTACTGSRHTTTSKVGSPGSAPAFHNPSDRSLGASAGKSLGGWAATGIKAVEGPVAVEFVCSPGGGARADVDLGGEIVMYPCDGRPFVTEFTPDTPADHVSVRVTRNTYYDIEVVER